MSVTIVSDDNNVGRGSGGGRFFDYMQNGYLWVVTVDATNNILRFYYSTDSGTTWSESSASQLSPAGTINPQICMFIDKDNNIHVMYVDVTNNKHWYQYGSAAADFKSFVWQPRLDITTGSLTPKIDGNDVVAVREGSGWKAHVITGAADGSSFANTYWKQINITASHVVSLDQSTLLKNFGAAGQPLVSIDFRHTAADSKDIQSSTPSLYVVYCAPGAVAGVWYRKIAYSAGVWTAGTERTIDATANVAQYVFSLVYDGTQIMFTAVKNATPTVLRVWERDEADTTTTARDPTALADGNVQLASIGVGKNSDVWIVAKANTSFDFKKIRFNRGGLAWDATWTLVEADTTLAGPDCSVGRGMHGQSEALGVAYELYNPAPNQLHYTPVFSAFEATALLQGVATIDPQPAVGMSGSATLQGVATLSPGTGVQGYAGGATLQGVATLDAAGGYKPSLDFTVYDLYLDDGQNVYACIAHEDDQTKGATRANPIRAEKQDVGQNPAEQRPEFGDYFAQGDFSHGGDQDYFHHVGRDERKYLVGEGFDISEPGLLRHLHTIGETLDSVTVGAVTQAAGVLFIADGTVVKKHDGALPGAWTIEDPHAGESATTVADVASRGAEIFAALGANGVHIRSAAGAWTHFKPDGSTALVAGTVTRVVWLKDRLMVVGNGGRSIFEVVADSTPDSLKTLPEGWTYESVFEAGAFIYAPAVNADAGLSRVHIFGLNNAGTSLEDKGSVPIPRGELIYAGIGDPGGVFIGGGRKTDAGGYDPVFYQAVQSDNGFLQLLKIAQGKGAQALDCSVRSFEALGDAIVMSWSVGSGAPEGARTGLAWYHLGRQAFAYHLRKVAPAAAPVTDIIFHRGALFFVVSGDGLFYEKTAEYVSEAYLISSIADWGSAGLKSWDASEVAHKALPATSSVLLQYTTEHPDQGDWTTVVSSSTAETLGAFGRLSDVVSRQFAVRILSRAVTALTSAPEIQSFSVRSNPTRSSPEFVLSRFVRVLAKDRKDGLGSEVFTDPVTRRIALLQLLDSWVTVYEPGITWTAFVKDVADAEPAEPFLNATNGERLKEAYLVRLDMVATGEAVVA